MTRIIGLTIGVGAMNGYAKEKGSELSSDSTQKWFLITTPLLMLYSMKKLDSTLRSPAQRIPVGILGGALVNGFAYCMGSKFGQITADFTERVVPATSRPPRVPPLRLHPLPSTSWPLGASLYAQSDPRSGSSNTEMR